MDRKESFDERESQEETQLEREIDDSDERGSMSTPEDQQSL